MQAYFSSVLPYLLVGFIVYLVFRTVCRLLYYKGEMRVPLWHEIGFALLAFWILVLFSASVTPALGFSLKEISLIPVKGMIDLTKEKGFTALLGGILKFVPVGFLLPFSFRRYQNFPKLLLLGGGISLFIEIFQLFLRGVTTSVDELLLSLLGIFLGYFLFGIADMYVPGFRRMGTVKRSRYRNVPFLIKKELELEDSNFENPDGDEAENHYTTVRDMVRIARACLQNEVIMELAGTKSSRALFENMDVTYKNTNLLLDPSSEYYYEHAIGLKTGSHSDAKCLIGAADIDGRRYVTAVMQDSEEGCWEDTLTLFKEAAGEGV